MILAFLFVAVVAAVVGAAGALLWVVPIAELSGKGMETVTDQYTRASHQTPDVRHNEPSVSQESSNE